MAQTPARRPSLATRRSPNNPFIYKYPEWSTYEKWKVIIMCCTLIPFVRILLGFAIAFVSLLIAMMFSIGVPSYKKGEVVQPLARWRRDGIQFVVACAARAILFCYGYHWIDVRGRPSKTSRIFVCNHKSLLDAFLCAAQFPSTFLSKADNLKLPIVGNILRLMQAITVDRTNKESKRAVLSEIQRRAVDTEFPALLVFPEGTTTNGEMLITFKPGAFSAKVPVQPVTLKYHSNNFDPAWVYSGPSMAELFLRTACQLNNSVTISFPDLVVPTGEDNANPRAFADRVRRIMAADLQVPVTQHSLEDSLLLSWGQAVNINVNVKMEEMRTRFQVGVRELKSMLEAFHEVDKDGDGRIGFEEFIEFFGLQDCMEYGESLFSALDRNESGYLDFKEFVVGLFLARTDTEASRQEKIEFAFRVYDVDKTNSISRAEGVKIIRNVNLDPKPTPEEETEYIKAIFGEDGSKEVTLEEFTEYVSRRADLLQVIPAAMEEYAKNINEACGSLRVAK